MRPIPVVELWRRLTPGRRTRVALVVVAACLLFASVIGLASHYRLATDPYELGLVAATPYLLLAAPLALLLLVAARQWIGVSLAAVVVGLGAMTQLPLYVAASAPTHGPAFVVMTANLRLGLAAPSEVVAKVRAHGVDILMLEELTPQEERRLIDSGLDEVLPYHESRPRKLFFGTGLWSRYPLTDARFPIGFTFALVIARVSLPGVAGRATCVAVHLSGPVPTSTNWERDIAGLGSLLNTLSREAPVIVGGDFNATPDTMQFRRLLTGGYRDAAAQAGAGVTATYPADVWFPPLIAIDHVLTRDAVATTVHTVRISGSDHRALVSTVILDRS